MRKVGLFVLMSGMLGGGMAFAQATGQELRAAKDCEKLAAPEKGHCVECVSRARPHHYHPDVTGAPKCQPAK